MGLFFHRKNRDGSTSTVPITPPQPSASPYASGAGFRIPPNSLIGQASASYDQQQDDGDDGYPDGDVPSRYVPQTPSYVTEPNQNQFQQILTKMFVGTESGEEILYQAKAQLYAILNEVQASQETKNGVNMALENAFEALSKFKVALMEVPTTGYKDALMNESFEGAFDDSQLAVSALKSLLVGIGKKIQVRYPSIYPSFQASYQEIDSIWDMYYEMEREVNVLLFGNPDGMDLEGPI